GECAADCGWGRRAAHGGGGISEFRLQRLCRARGARQDAACDHRVLEAQRGRAVAAIPRAHGGARHDRAGRQHAGKTRRSPASRDGAPGRLGEAFGPCAAGAAALSAPQRTVRHTFHGLRAKCSGFALTLALTTLPLLVVKTTAASDAFGLITISPTLAASTALASTFLPPLIVKVTALSEDFGLITISPAVAAPTVTSNAATMAAGSFIFGHLSSQWNSCRVRALQAGRQV